MFVRISSLSIQILYYSRMLSVIIWIRIAAIVITPYVRFRDSNGLNIVLSYQCPIVFEKCLFLYAVKKREMNMFKNFIRRLMLIFLSCHCFYYFQNDLLGLYTLIYISIYIHIHTIYMMLYWLRMIQCLKIW